MTGPVAPAKAAAPAASTATRGAASAADAAPDGNAFMLALGACSAEADAAPADQALGEGATTALNADAPTVTVPAPLTVEPAPVLPTVPAVDAAALLAQGAFGAMPAPSPSSTSDSAPSATGVVGAITTAAGAGTPLPSASTSVASVAASTPPIPADAQEAPARAAPTAAFAAATAPAMPKPPADVLVPARGHAAAGAPHSHAAWNSWQTQAQAQAQALMPAASHEAAAKIAPDAAASARFERTVAEPAMQAALASTIPALRRSERGDERGAGMFSSVSGVDARPAFAPGGTALMPGIDAASAGAGSGQNGLAERMVEQVSWWLSQRTQGAELTLDVPGGAPVSVSIQVQGNEAQVAFRSDQPEARQLLAGAMSQLKDMLGAEGLLLSGSSVGTGANGDRSGDAPSGTPLRTGQIVADAAPGTAAPARLLPAGRTLDLYV